MPIASIDAALDDLRAGRPIILVDDEDREHEGDLVVAAEFATPQVINFMAREGRGLICIAMTGERLDALRIPLMVPSEGNTSASGTAFTVSVEARRGVTTGISAFDRATTIRTLIDPATRPEDLARPGHVFPLRAAEGGVWTRAGHTEASVDLARLAGLYPAAVICEIMHDDGTMARRPELERFAARHSLQIISIADLIAYRRQTPSGALHSIPAPLPAGCALTSAALFHNGTSLNSEPSPDRSQRRYSGYAPDAAIRSGTERIGRQTMTMQREEAVGQTFEGHLIGTGLKFGIVISRFNDTLGKELLRGAQETLIRHGVAEGDIDVFWAPGAFEVPQVARWIARRKGVQPQRSYYNAIIGLGVVIRGATPHFDYVAGQAASGIASAAFDTGLPITFGMVTAENLEQALERAGTKAGNRGAEAAVAAIEMANLRRLLDD